MPIYIKWHQASAFLYFCSITVTTHEFHLSPKNAAMPPTVEWCKWSSPRGAGVLSKAECWPASALRDSALILPLQIE